MKSFMLFVILVSLFSSCGNEEPQDLISKVNEVKTDGLQVKKYLDEGIYLDVDIQTLSLDANGLSRSSNDDNLCKMKAVLYRFYSHVKTIDGKNVCSLKNAQEINISEELFSILQKNLKAGNDWIEKCKKEGKEVIVGEVNDEYLKSLLE